MTEGRELSLFYSLSPSAHPLLLSTLHFFLSRFPPLFFVFPLSSFSSYLTGNNIFCLIFSLTLNGKKIEKNEKERRTRLRLFLFHTHYCLFFLSLLPFFHSLPLHTVSLFHLSFRNSTRLVL